MATSIECCEDEIETAVDRRSASMMVDDLLRSVAASVECALLLDFDGTLAPFRVDPRMVRPWAGIVGLLDRIQQAGRTRVAIVTGRPAGDVASQLGLRNTPEIWGLHGAERLYPDGRLEEEELIGNEQELLAAARSAVHEAQLGLRIEEKRNAVVVHWRGKSTHAIQSAQTRAMQLLRPFADKEGMNLLQFDGGLELRTGRHKGDAVRMILAEIGDDAPVAYLGDDATDEHAFAALGERGLSVLVRREWRPTAAPVWLRPPAQLREFLAAWLQATQD